MFREFFRFEIRYHMSRISTYVYFAIFFALGFFTMLAAGGAFPDANISVGGSGGKTFANAPYVLHIVISLFSYFGVIISSAIVGSSVYRDYEFGVHPLFYSKPIGKFSYLGGRFFGAMTVVFLVFTSIGLGTAIATMTPWVDAEKIAPFRLMSYVQPYLTAVLPNLLFTSAIFFALAAITRNILVNYVTSVVFLIGYLIAVNLIGNLDNKFMASLIDPFGNIASVIHTEYWSVAERNTQLVTLSGNLLYNRLLWTGLGMLILGFTYYRFSFSQFSGISLKKKKKSIAESEAVSAPVAFNFPKAEQEFSFANYLRQYFMQTKNEALGIVQSLYFMAIVLAGVLFLFSSANQLNIMYGTSVYPVTYSVLEIIGGSFTLFMLIIITFYAGELIWRDREMRVNQLYDALPVPGWVPLLSKLSALILIQVLLLGVIMLCGMIIQTSKGYFNYEAGLYLQTLFGMKLPDYILLCVLAITVHVLVNHKYTGHFIMVIYYLLSLFMSSFGFEHNLYNFGGDPGYTYSDMNGFGHFVGPYFWFKLYWAAFAILLALVSHIFWVRSTEDSWIARLRAAAGRLTRPVVTAIVLGFFLFAAAGAHIFYNTNVLNTYKTSAEEEKESADFEKKYRHLKNSPQPRVTDVNVNVNLYPSERSFDASGIYILKNKTGSAIDSIQISLPDRIRIEEISFGRGHSVVLADTKSGYYIYRLSSPLQPQDSLKLAFRIRLQQHGFQNTSSGTSLVYNGSFMNSGYMPSIGYPAGYELQEDDTRKKHDLQPKERMAAVDDSAARMNTYIASDSDWINFEATVSTSPDQIAIAPGYLQKEWTKDGRRYFHYKMDAPILNFYSFLSARYEVRRDKWNDVAIEVYYHKGHEYNIDKMIYAVKKSLDYYTANFSPYQHRQVRIIEFPRYASFAQSFPNTIPYSESIGFIAKVNDSEEDINYPFYITAHEVAHQWWAHQVIGGDVQGSTLLSESMSQYSALMVMEKEFGRDKMQKFLRYELNSYLNGRSSERKKELPLYLVENQQYIHYNKGSLVLYALRDYIGEENLNRALSNYIKAVGFQAAPFTNSLEFLSHIKAATPDSLQYLVQDLFEKITLYDNKAVAANYTKRSDGKYDVSLRIESKKFYADSLGNESSAALREWIDVGVFGEEGDSKVKKKELYFRKHRIDKPVTELKLVVDSKPAEAGIDPYNKLIDRHPDDNVMDVESSSQ